MMGKYLRLFTLGKFRHSNVKIFDFVYPSSFLLMGPDLEGRDLPNGTMLVNLWLY